MLVASVQTANRDGGTTGAPAGSARLGMTREDAAGVRSIWLTAVKLNYDRHITILTMLAALRC